MPPQAPGGWSLENAQPVLLPTALDATGLLTFFVQAQITVFNGAS